MFGWNVYSTWDSSKFTIIVPLHYIALLIAAFWIFIIFIFFIKSGHTIRNTIIIAGLLLAFGFLMYSSELTLDRSTGTATLKEFQYYHWSTHTYPLRDLDRISVSTGSTTSRLTMQLKTGPTVAIDFLDQTGGKDEAAHAANDWLDHAH